MKVWELINLLDQVDPDAKVVASNGMAVTGAWFNDEELVMVVPQITIDEMRPPPGLRPA